MKTLVLVRHGESEYNASLQPERQEFSLKQVGPGGTFLHHPKLLGMQIIISFIIIYNEENVSCWWREIVTIDIK